MHTSTPGYYGGLESTGHADDAYGYAVSGAVEFKNLPTGTGDSLKLEASYGKGAARYVFTGGTLDTQGGGRFAKFDGQTVGFGYVLDGVFAPGGQIQQSTAWEVSGFFEHYWNPAWRTSLYGNYSHISYGDAGNALLLAAFSGAGSRLGSASAAASAGAAAANISGTTGNFDFGIIEVGTRTAWTPVQNLTLSAQFTYTRLEQELGGAYNVTPATGVGGKVPGAYAIQNQNLYNGSVQILRSF